MKRLQKPWTTTSRIPEILHVMLNLLLIYDLAVIGVGLNSSADFPVSYTHLTLPTNREV